MTNETEVKPKKSIWKKWWLWVIVVIIIFFYFVSIVSRGTQDRVEQARMEMETLEQALEIPQYSLLDKTEHISTRALDDEASYFGDVLVEEDVMSIPPEAFIETARAIAKKEGLNYSARFYITEKAYRANYDSTWEGSYEALWEGYIGTLENDEFRMSPSSDYYERHKDNDEWIIK